MVGRRRTSRCRCGNLLVFDGRALASSVESGATDAQPFEPTLTPSPALSDRPALSDNPARSDSPAEPAVDSQTIGRIRLRKAEPRPAETPTERQRPRAPGTRADNSPSEPPESPRSLREAFDTLDLDRLAESIRPTWEAPPSRRVTEPGDDPEVVVHYPPEWQPPPSERRRMRASWEVTPTLPLSLAARTASVDDAWEAPDALRAEPIQEAPVAAEAPRAPETTASVEAPVAAAAAAAAMHDTNSSGADSDRVPHVEARVGKSGGPGLDSTAPTAVTQHPPALPRSPTRLWATGLAAAALVALVWRGSNTRATDASATHAAPPTAAEHAEIPEADVPAPVAPAAQPFAPAARAALPPTTPAPTPPPPTPRLPAEVPVTAPVAPPPAVAPTPPRVRPAAVAAPAGRVASPAVPRAATPSAPTPSAPTPSAPAPRASAEPSAPASAPEATGPDQREVAQALGLAAARARACPAPNGPAGDGSIRVLLDPAGGVLNATALGAFQGTPAGACVENAFRGARTPAYAGPSLSTVYPFSISID